MDFLSLFRKWTPLQSPWKLNSDKCFALNVWSVKQELFEASHVELFRKGHYYALPDFTFIFMCLKFIKMIITSVKQLRFFYIKKCFTSLDCQQVHHSSCHHCSTITEMLFLFLLESHENESKMGISLKETPSSNIMLYLVQKMTCSIQAL